MRCFFKGVNGTGVYEPLYLVFLSSYLLKLFFTKASACKLELPQVFNFYPISNKGQGFYNFLAIAAAAVLYYIINNMKELIKVFNSRIEAELAKGYLKSNGIDSYISSDDAGQMYPSQQLVGGVSLLVASRDRETASQLLDQIETKEKYTG